MKKDINSELFINARYLGTSALKFRLFICKNGVLKQCKISSSENSMLCKLSTLPPEVRQSVSKIYYLEKGILKRYIASTRTKKLIRSKDLLCKLEDLSEEAIEQLTTIYDEKGNKISKSFILSTGSWKKAQDQNEIWCKLSDLPFEIQESLSHMANTLSEITHKKEPTVGIYDNSHVKIFVDGDTLLVPVVGRLLPSDGIYAYTIKLKHGKPSLESIVVCWNCHWSDLFAGNTEFGNNVFCLFTDLSEQQQKDFYSDAIPLKDIPQFLGLENHQSKIIRFGKKSSNK